VGKGASNAREGREGGEGKEKGLGGFRMSPVFPSFNVGILTLSLNCMVYLAFSRFDILYNRHNFELPDRVSHFTDCNFNKRMLFSGIY